MYFSIYDYLPSQARQIREQVFAKEQGFHEEFDVIDEHCQHILAFASPLDWEKLTTSEKSTNQKTHEPVAVATSRFFTSNSEGEFLSSDQHPSKSIYTIGRVAVDKAWRGRHIGAQLLAATEEAIRQRGGQTILLHAQEQAKDFYLKQGYVIIGERDFEENCPHIWMRKELNKA